ncbi:hypothetical protein NST17_20125 [Caldifermentibacillus hisashii]|uniref:DUF1398 domain-containing protein n=1 Tax=Caldifermentibacillus hisashii TaxID=996558 RepID=A0ABU9K582_9BACI
MITKKELKDWLDENARVKYAEKLEEYIDKNIKENALAGNTTFYISTGKCTRYTLDGGMKTSFYDIWNTKELSNESRKLVQEKVINKYREFGFDIEETTVDCGWDKHYFALKFHSINKVIED